MSRALNSAANSGPSVGASSLVTDANSALSGGGAHLQRSASINAESYARLPASPMSFSSNNISISGSSVLDTSSMVQQSPNQDQNSQRIPHRHQQGASSATSQITMPTGQINLTSMQVPYSLIQDPNSLLPMQKKPRLDIKQEDIFQQQVIQQLLQRQDSMPLQSHQPQLQALYQQKILQQRHQQQQQQQLLQSLPPMQRAQLQQQQQQQQQQLRLQLQQQAAQPPFATKRPYESGICARRLMQYLYHQRHRPPDNSILYWRKFVAEYFAPRAKKRWCLSMYDNVGQHALGVFPQAAMDAWHCEICGSKSGRGFETTYDVLPRLSKIKFDSGVIDELLFLGMPQEFRYSNGVMMLEYGKAIQESVYEHLRVVREGQLRIIFTPDLKILSWEFCARRHEELLPRRLVAPQVNQLVQVAQKYQNAVNEGGSTGVSVQDLQTNCNMFVTAGRQLAKNLDLQSLNDLGFSKRYVRCLQIAEVVNSMKDLVDFSKEHDMGPIESLKNYPRHTAAAKMQMQKMQEMGHQLANAPGVPADHNTLNKIMAMNPGLSGHMNNNMGGGTPNNAAQTAMAMSKYQNLLRQNSINSSSSSGQPDVPHFTSSNQAHTLTYQGSVHSLPSPSVQNASSNSLASAHLSQNAIKHGQSSSHSNSNPQQDVIQQLLQEMMVNNSGVMHHPSLSGQNPSAMFADGVFSGAGGTGTFPMRAGVSMVGFGNNTLSMPNNPVAPLPSRTNSFKSLSNSSPTVSGNSYGIKQELQSHHLPEMVPDIPRDFSERGIFDDEAFIWKS